MNALDIRLVKKMSGKCVNVNNFQKTMQVVMLWTLLGGCYGALVGWIFYQAKNGCFVDTVCVYFTQIVNLNNEREIGSYATDN